jgi:hypothetical protein
VAFGQGQFNMANYVTAAGITAKAIDASTGNPIEGPGWVAQAYESDSEMGSFTPIPDTVKSFRESGAGAGYLLGGVVTVPGTPENGTVWVKLYTWNNNDGADYDAAMAAGGAVGMSNPVQLTLGGVTVTPPDMAGLQEWTVSGEVIPEPSTFALGLLGIGALMLRRRK